GLETANHPESEGALMTAKDKRSREIYLERQHANYCARLMRDAKELSDIAANPRKTPEGKFEAVSDHAVKKWEFFGLHIGLFCGKNPAQFLRRVALAYEGKLQGRNAERDDLLEAAIHHAIDKRRRRRKGQGLDVTPLTSAEIDDAIAIVSGKT